MKTSMIILFLLAGTVSLYAQDLQTSQVPAAVQETLKKKFPNVTDIKWKLKGEQYRAEFKIEKRGHDLWIDKSGVIKKFKQDIPKSDLPAVIKQKVTTDFKGFTIDDADKIEQDNKLFYQVKLKGQTGEKKVLFSSDGTVVADNVE